MKRTGLHMTEVFIIIIIATVIKFLRSHLDKYKFLKETYDDINAPSSTVCTVSI